MPVLAQDEPAPVEIGDAITCVSDIGCTDRPEIIEELPAAAADARVEPSDLLGALNTIKAESGVQLTAYEYLYAVGDLKVPFAPGPMARPTGPAVVVPRGSVWDGVAWCESRGHWGANTGNGYYGGLQMDKTFWANHGGLRYADRPDHASPAAQIQVAINGRDGLVGKAQGWGAWPNCHP